MDEALLPDLDQRIRERLDAIWTLIVATRAAYAAYSRAFLIWNAAHSRPEDGDRTERIATARADVETCEVAWLALFGQLVNLTGLCPLLAHRLCIERKD